MLVSVTELKNQIKSITTLDGVFDFLQNNSAVLHELELRAEVDIFNYHAQIMGLLEAKQKELQKSQQTKG